MNSWVSEHLGQVNSRLLVVLSAHPQQIKDLQGKISTGFFTADLHDIQVISFLTILYQLFVIDQLLEFYKQLIEYVDEGVMDDQHLTLTS